MLLHPWAPLMPAVTWGGALLLIALAWHHELRRKTLPLTWIAGTVVCGTLLRAAVSGLGFSLHESQVLWPQAWAVPSQLAGAGASVSGAAMALVLLRPVQSLGWTGRNEVRLMAALGSLLGPAATLQLGAMVVCTGALLALMQWAWQWHSNWVLARGVLSLARMLPGSVQTFEPAVRGTAGLPCGVKTIAFAVLAHAVWGLTTLPVRAV